MIENVTKFKISMEPSFPVPRVTVQAIALAMYLRDIKNKNVFGSAYV